MNGPASINVATHNTFLPGDTGVATGTIFAGAVNIEPTQSGVFCNAAIIDASLAKKQSDRNPPARPVTALGQRLFETVLGTVASVFRIDGHNGLFFEPTAIPFSTNRRTASGRVEPFFWRKSGASPKFGSDELRGIRR